MYQEIPEAQSTIDSKQAIDYQTLKQYCTLVATKSPAQATSDQYTYTLGISKRFHNPGCENHFPKATVRLIARLMVQFPVRVKPVRMTWTEAREALERMDASDQELSRISSMLGLYQSYTYHTSAHETMTPRVGNLMGLYMTSIEQTNNLDFAWNVFTAEAVARGKDVRAAKRLGLGNTSLKDAKEDQSHMVSPHVYSGPINNEAIERLILLKLQIPSVEKNLALLLSVKPKQLAEFRLTSNPKIHPTICLMLRALLSRPDLAPFPSANTLPDLVERIQHNYPEYSLTMIYMCLGLSKSSSMPGRVNMLDPSRSLLNITYMITECMNLYGDRFWKYYVDNIVNVDAQSVGFSRNELFEHTGWDIYLRQRDLGRYANS